MFRLRALLLFLPLLFAGCPGDSTESACVQLETSNRRTFIRDYQYDRYRIFDIGKFGGVSYLGPGDSVIAFFLYQGVGPLEPNEPEAVAYPNSLDPASSPDSVYQRFRQLDYGYDYELFMDPDAGQNYVFFPERLPNVQTTTLAYHMVVKKADGSMLVFGDLTDVPFRLQMLKRTNPQPIDGLWEAEWKNVYSLRRTHIDYSYLDLDILRGDFGDEDNPANLNHQNGTQFLHLMGLDQVGEHGAPPPDGKVDDNAAILDTARGLLVFPFRYPFADSTVLEEWVSAIYSSSNPNDLRDSSKFYLRLKDEVFTLGHEDVVESSVQVFLNGRELSSGFSVDGPAGELILTEPFAYVPFAVIKVCFEYWK